MIVNINGRGISIRRYIVYQTKGSPVAKRPGFFMSGRLKKGRYVMKFLLLVLAIHLVAEMVSNKIKAGKENKSV